MHFDQQTMTQIRERAMALERARTQLDTAQKQCAEWDVIERLQANFDAAQEAMVNVGVQASASLPRAVKAEA
jgi:hypothetical protein